jgi:hypothetical protein
MPEPTSGGGWSQDFTLTKHQLNIMGNIPMTTNDTLVQRAQNIAARKGGNWHDHLISARRESHIAPVQLQKIVRKSADRREEKLRKAANLAAHDRQLLGHGSPDPDCRREIHDCVTDLGRVHVSVSRDEIGIAGVMSPLGEIDADLRDVIISTSSAFSEATNQEEQSRQRTLVALVVQAILNRHQFLNASVKQSIQRVRYGV